VLEGDIERPERVRDAGIAPVEDPQLPVATIDVAAVQVVVLDRLRDAARLQLGVQRAEALRERAQPCRLVGGDWVR